MSRNLFGTIGVILVAAAVLTFGATNASAELILNGSFEQNGGGLGTSNNWYLYNLADLPPIFPTNPPANRTTLTSWHVGYPLYVSGNPVSPFGNYVDGNAAKWPTAHDGQYYTMFHNSWGAATPESIDQGFSVTTGLLHTVSFWQMERPGQTLGQVTAMVELDAGGATGDLSLTTSTGDTAWTEYTFSFTPDTTTTATLTFQQVASYVFVDDVSVTAIPEPGTLALLATGLIGLLCYAWRKRK